MLEALIGKAKKSGADEAEILLAKSTAVSIDVLNQEIESVDSLEFGGIGIRVIKNKRLGFAYTSNFDELDKTIEKSLANSKDTYPDEFNALPTHKTIEPFNLKTYDEALLKVSTQDKINFALEMEKSAYSFDKRVKKTEKISYSDSEYEVELINSNGLHLKYKGNHCGASADVIAEADGEAESGFGFGISLEWKKLDPKIIGEEAAQHAVSILGASPIPSQKIPVIFDPPISAQLLGIISGIVSADAVQKGRSLFIGKLGKKVSSACLTIEDHGRLSGAIGSAPFDGEGVATQQTMVIENGILKSYLYNTYTALKDKVKSTGNAARGYSSTPSIGPTNLFIKPGKTISTNAHSRLLYITRLMGLHTINPISGEFSVGACGIFLSNGERVQAVRGITIAGNLIDLLEKIEAVGSDLRFFGNIGAPALLVSKVSISG